MNGRMCTEPLAPECHARMSSLTDSLDGSDRGLTEHLPPSAAIPSIDPVDDLPTKKLLPLYGSKDEIIQLNVGGVRFTTFRSTLEKIPNTRLSCLSRTDEAYREDSGEYFYDRNPNLFHCILDFYRTHELHFPHNFCGPSVKKELLYWRLNEAYISPCCWHRYRQFEDEQKIFDTIENAFESDTSSPLEKTEESYTGNTVFRRWEKFREKAWLFLEDPMSSRAAKTWTGCFMGIVLISICVLCFETTEFGRDASSIQPPPDDVTSLATRWENGELRILQNETCRCQPNITTTPAPDTTKTAEQHEIDRLMRENPKMRLILNSKMHPVLEVVDAFCAVFFTLEFMARLLFCPSKKMFFLTVMNVIDFLCVLPMWIKYILVMGQVEVHWANPKIYPVFFLLMTLRVLRIFRVLRLARHYMGLKILLLAVKESISELCMLFVFLFIIMLIFAVVIYYAEFTTPETFPNIPICFWWAIVTLTTVGYGDMVPKSVLGYMVGGCCALTGVLALSLQVPIIANNFNMFYSQAQLITALEKRKAEHRKHSTQSTANSNSDMLARNREGEGAISEPEETVV